MCHGSIWIQEEHTLGVEFSMRIVTLGLILFTVGWIADDTLDDTG